MSKSWNEVLQSEQYQKLTDQQKFLAAQQYFSEVVAAKPEFQKLSDEQKQKAAYQFSQTISYTKPQTTDTIISNMNTAMKQKYNVPVPDYHIKS